MEDQSHMDFSARLDQAMDGRGLRQADLVRMAAADGVKLGKSQLSQYLSGKTEPRKATLAFLATALGVSAEWLSGETDDAAPPEMRQRENSSVSSIPTKKKESAMPHRQFKKSSKLDNVLYDIRGPVLDEAYRMEDQGIHVLKLNIGNPAPFGFRTPDEVVKDMQDQLTECEATPTAAASSPRARPSCSTTSSRAFPTWTWRTSTPATAPRSSSSLR